MSAYRESADDDRPKAYIVLSENPRYPNKNQILFLDKLISIRVESKHINSSGGERWYPIIVFEVDSGVPIKIERYTSQPSEKDWTEAREYIVEIANKKQRWLEYCARLGRPVTLSISEETNPADNR